MTIESLVTGQILCPPSSDQNHTVFLQVVTLSWNIRLDDFPIAYSYPACFSLRRVGFLGFLDQGFQDDRFLLKTALQDWRARFLDFLERFLFDGLVYCFE
jgi:hypothetical protein